MTVEADEAFAALEEGVDFGLAEVFVTEGDVDLEVEHCVEAEETFVFLAYGYGDLGLLSCLPPVGESGEEAVVFDFGDGTEEGVGFVGGPGEGVVDVTSVYKFGYKGDLFGGTVYRLEESDESGFVLGTGVFLEGVGEGLKLDASALADARGVGGHEGEGVFEVVLVFGEVEAYASDLVPFRGVFFEPVGEVEAAGCDGVLGPLVEGLPVGAERFGGEVLAANHGRCVEDYEGTFLFARGGDFEW